MKRNASNTKQYSTASDPLSERITIRLTKSELSKVQNLARTSGSTISRYARGRLLNERLYHHLSDKEADAYISLADARADLVHIKNSLSGKSQEQLLAFFRNPDFMHEWITSVDTLIKRWYEIEATLND